MCSSFSCGRFARGLSGTGGRRTAGAALFVSCSCLGRRLVFDAVWRPTPEVGFVVVFPISTCNSGESVGTERPFSDQP